MADFTLTREQHDATICADIGEAAGQTDWPIKHRNDGDNVILTLPDGVLTRAQFDAVVFAHVPPVAVAPVDRDAQLVADLQGTPTVAQLTAALRRRFGG
jgi:hypothetical protein